MKSTLRIISCLIFVFVAVIPISHASAAQGFDYKSYLSVNPDLPQDWGKAEAMNHFIHYGFAEGRALSFDLEEYLKANKDLPRDFTYEQALSHYNTYGKMEGRLLAFDAGEYTALYGDLPDSWNYDQALNHYMNNGKNEGRFASFDEDAYLDMYTDLPVDWNQIQAFSHYFHYGQSEGRSFDAYDESSFGASFSPIKAFNSAGALVTSQWRYEINDGTPLQIDYNGTSLTFSFDNLSLSINPNTFVREADFSGNVSGSASGNFSANSRENLSAVAGKTLVEEQEITMDLSLTVLGESARIYLDALTTFNPAAEWFIDRSDLNDLPIGYTYNAHGTISGKIDASVTISGALDYSEDFNSTIIVPETWTIISHHDSMTVNGTTYSDIVKVTRTTVIPDYVNGSISDPQVNIDYWVAKGIGMIKGIGQYQLMGQSLTIELVETNLTQ